MTPDQHWHFPTEAIGQRVWLFESVPSTNDVALTLAGSAESVGLVILARHQTQGRGQYGRTWQSTPGHALLASVILRPPQSVQRPVILTAWAAVAISRAIHDLCGLRPSIKWPNDLLLQGKKICGILIEQHQSTILGFGLNLNQSADEFLRADLPAAGSLAMLGGKPIAYEQAVERVVQHLDETYQQLCEQRTSLLETEWRQALALLGKMVQVHLMNGDIVSGTVHDLTWEGLILEQGDRAFTHYLPETIRNISPLELSADRVSHK